MSKVFEKMEVWVHVLMEVDDDFVSVEVDDDGTKWGEELQIRTGKHSTIKTVA
jgi:hypothetical protein